MSSRAHALAPASILHANTRVRNVHPPLLGTRAPAQHGSVSRRHLRRTTDPPIDSSPRAASRMPSTTCSTPLPVTAGKGKGRDHAPSSDDVRASVPSAGPARSRRSETCSREGRDRPVDEGRRRRLRAVRGVALSQAARATPRAGSRSGTTDAAAGRVLTRFGCGDLGHRPPRPVAAAGSTFASRAPGAVARAERSVATRSGWTSRRSSGRGTG